MDRKIYKLEYRNETGSPYIRVIRTNNNLGLQGYVYPNGSISAKHSGIPKYIIKECLEIFKKVPKDSLITLNTAKIAQRLGFNLKCNAFYGTYHEDVSKVVRDDNYSGVEYQLLQKRDYGIYAIQIKDWNDSNVYDNYDVFCKKKYSAPTQALLAKWLRETHNIHIQIEYLDVNSWKASIIKGRIVKKLSLYCTTYEEALECGLLNCEKLV